MKTADEYIESMRKMHFELYMFGERVTNHVDNPIIRPTIIVQQQLMNLVGHL